MEDPKPNNSDWYQRKCALLESIVNLWRSSSPEELIGDGLRQLVDLLGATQGYIELRSPADPELSWEASHSLDSDETREVRRLISKGFIAEALAQQRAIRTGRRTDSAHLKSRQSVRLNGIQHVLCAPIGREPALGVVYLQSRREGEAFTREDQSLVESFAHQLSPIARRLLTSSEGREDPTQPYRERLSSADIVGRSRALASTLRAMADVASLSATVLLTGPTGGGKSLLAKVIHNSSGRRGAFVARNCSTLPETLIESALFGTVKGAFTGAEDRPGAVEEAENGTLFLDEIGDTSPAFQVKLLRLLQEGEFERVGEVKTRQCQTRLIAATHHDLAALVKEGKFRQDLYYRLKVVPIRVPSLDERREDIALLAEAFVPRLCEKLGVPAMKLSSSALATLEHRRWPGSVRELEHCVQRGIIHANGESAAEIEPHHLVDDASDSVSRKTTPHDYTAALRDWQNRYLRGALSKHAWNVDATAEAIGIHRSTLYRMINSLSLAREA